jgi:hypothetical protein
MPAGAFDLDGVRVRVRTSGDGLAHVVDRLLGAYRTSVTDNAELHIELDKRAQAPAMPREQPRFRFPPMSAFTRPDGKWLLVDDIGVLEVDPLAGNVNGWASQHADLRALSRFAGLPVWVALLECLRGRGRYAVHAAALIDRQGKSIVLAGRKGAGKSTATLALLEAGYTVITDDTLFIDLGHAEPLIGYRKRFHLRRDLCARRPHLATFIREPAEFEPADKAWLDVASSHPGCVRDRGPRPHRVLFPEITSAARSRLVPLTPRQAMVELLAHSAFAVTHAAFAADHLSALAWLVAGASAARLVCGRDLYERPSGYRDLMEGEACTFAASASN